MSQTTIEETPPSHHCCIVHEFFKSASQNPNKIAVVHATGGLRLCRDLRERRIFFSEDAVVEEWCQKFRESSNPSLYKGDLRFTYGEILEAVDSLSRRVRRMLDDVDVVRPGGNSRTRKRLDVQKIGISDNYGRFPHIVGVNIGPSVEYIIAVLSILRCGEAFLPLDPLWPEERTALITSVSNASLVIKCNHSSHSTGGFEQDEPDRTANCACSVLHFSMQKGLSGNIDQPELVWPCQDKNPRLFSYLMYTSGSTGKPKGVCGMEKGLSNRFVWMQDLYPLLKDDVLLFKTSISFIDHIQEFLGAILTCTPIVVPPFNEMKENPFYLVDILKVYNISRLVTVPSLMRAVIPILQNSTTMDLHRSLKLLVLSGELFSISLWKVLCKLLPNTTILNLYGTTEVSGDCTYFDCKNLTKLLDTEIVSSVPIGIPITNCDVIIHGDHQHYEEGEIKVYGSCLFLGYIDDFYHGFYKKYTGSRQFFSTGDFARRLQSGDIVIVGRNDRIVKINGQRIALDEIENALIEYPDVDAAAVTFHGNLSNSSNLKAYIVQGKKNETQAEQITSGDNQHVDEGLVFSIKSWLLKKLPLGMLPSHYIFIDKLPLFPSGKIDYSILKISVSMQNKRRIFNGDRDFQDHLKIIKEIFCDALQVEEIEDEADFFSLGGNSISAAQVAFKLSINMKLLYQYSSPFQLLNFLIKPPHNFLTNHGKRLKLKDMYFFDGEDRHKIISKNKNDSSSSGLISTDIPLILRHSLPKDDSSWLSNFPKDSRYSFSRCNKVINGIEPSLNNPNDAKYILEMTSREDIFMQELWKVSLDSCVDASPLLILKDGYFHLIIGSHAHLLLCVNAQTGDIRWEMKLEDRIECSASVTGDFSQIVVGCFKGNIYFIDIMTGRISWVFQTYGEVKMQPVAYKNLMWCGSHDHMLYALDHCKQCCVYKIYCGGSIYGSPVVDEMRNMLYVATTSGHVTAISVKDLSFHTVWLYKAGVPIFGSLCLHASSGNVICCLVDGNVLSLDLKGSLLWKVSTGGPIFSAACMSSVLPSQVLICSRSGSVYSFEVEGGILLWEYHMGSPITASAYVDEQIPLQSMSSGPPDRLVCICSSSGSIHVLRVNSRSSEAEHSQQNTSPEKIACFILPGDIFSSPIMIGGRIFVGCRDEYLHCVCVYL